MLGIAFYASANVDLEVQTSNEGNHRLKHKTGFVTTFVGKKHTKFINKINTDTPLNSVTIFTSVKNIHKLHQLGKQLFFLNIQYDHWIQETRNFVINNRGYLKTIDVVGFFSCLTLSKNTVQAKQKAENYAKKIRNIVPEIKLEEVSQFADVLDYSKMQFAKRIIAKAIMGIMGVQEGDYRDWNMIKSWCRKLHIEN